MEGKRPLSTAPDEQAGHRSKRSTLDTATQVTALAQTRDPSVTMDDAPAASPYSRLCENILLETLGGAQRQISASMSLSVADTIVTLSQTCGMLIRSLADSIGQNEVLRGESYLGAKGFFSSFVAMMQHRHRMA